ncbi:eCIS core domain-containing protein [Deinococcus sp. UYEF24]
MFQRQDQGRLQATQAQADHLLLVQHAQVQRATDQAQQAHDELSEHTALERIQARRGSGQPLPEDVRRQLELGLNHDLSGVRIHLDAEADLIARSLGALAFTSGRDIYFQMGEYNPASKLDLLAHEAAHVRQQDQGQVAQGLDPDAGLETQAQKFGEEFALGQASGSNPKAQVTAQKKTPSAPAAPQLAVQRLTDPAPAAGFWFAAKWTHQFAGTLGKSHITMTLTRSGDRVKGTYQYQGHTGSLNLDGKINSLSNMASLTELDLKAPDGTKGTAQLILTADSDTTVRGSWVSGGKDLPISLTVADIAPGKQLPVPQPDKQKQPDQPDAGLVNPAFQTALIDSAMAAGIKHGLLARANRATVSATVPKILAECLRDHVTDPASIAVIIGNAMRESKLDPGAHEGMFYTTLRALRKAFSTGRFGGHDPASFLRNPEALANQVYAHQLGNGDVASGDGYRFRGRGLPQTTGRANYAKLNDLDPQPLHDGVPVDFTKNPDLAADEALSIQILVQGISQGVFTGTIPLKDFLALRSLDLATFTAARRKYVGNLDASLVGAVTAEIYQAIKGTPFLQAPSRGGQP